MSERAPHTGLIGITRVIERQHDGQGESSADAKRGDSRGHDGRNLGEPSDQDDADQNQSGARRQIASPIDPARLSRPKKMLPTVAPPASAARTKPACVIDSPCSL